VKRIVPLKSGLIASFLIVAGAVAEPTLPPTAEMKSFDFRDILRRRPLELCQLLGRHFSEVAPGVNWEQLAKPEDYKNASVRYGVFSRGADLQDRMKEWSFKGDKICVSSYSMFLLFFNRGYVFKVELRYIPDTFTGTVAPNAPGFCADEKPIFDMIAKELGLRIIEQKDGVYKVMHYTSLSLMTLSTGGGVTDWSCDLRGGPSLP
jgi:hypothetical protein